MRLSIDLGAASKRFNARCMSWQCLIARDRVHFIEMYWDSPSMKLEIPAGGRMSVMLAVYWRDSVRMQPRSRCWVTIHISAISWLMTSMTIMDR